MSYIYFFKPRDGESVDEAYERIVEADEEEDKGPPVAEKEALKVRLAKALADAGSGIERSANVSTTCGSGWLNSADEHLCRH